MILVPDLYWMFAPLAGVGFMVILTEAEGGPPTERTENMIATLWFGYTLFLVGQHIDQGYVWFPDRHWTLRIGATGIVLSVASLTAFAVGMWTGLLLVKIYEGLAAIARGCIYLVTSFSLLVWKFGLGQTWRLIVRIVRGVKGLFRRMRTWKGRTA
jgi:hypothetical protein